MRPDPLRDKHPVSDKRRTRFSASSLRGFRLLRQGIFPACRLESTADQTITTATVTKVAFNQARYDSPGDEGGGDAGAKMADLTNNDIIIRQSGLYIVSAGIYFATNTTGRRALLVQSGSTTIIYDERNPITASAVQTPVQASAAIVLARGDLIRANAFHTRGSDLDIEEVSGGSFPYLSVAWVAL